MNLRIRRRRFGQLALASAATAAISSLASKTQAQAANLPAGLVGVKIATTTTSPKPLAATNAVTTAAETNVPKIANTTPPISILESDRTTTSVGRTTVENTGTIPDAVDRAVSLLRSERATSITSNPDGTLVTATVKDRQKVLISHLIFTSPKATQADRAITLSGFNNPNAVIESLVPIANGQYLCIFSLNRGIPPFTLGLIDSQTGIVTSGTDLALPDLQLEGARFSNLTKSPDGTIYATSLSRDGFTRVVQLDLNNKSLISGKGKIIRVLELSIKNQPLENDALSLAFSPSGTLYALANPTRKTMNTLYGVDISKNKGDLNSIADIDVDKITFRPI